MAPRLLCSVLLLSTAALVVGALRLEGDRELQHAATTPGRQLLQAAPLRIKVFVPSGCPAADLGVIESALAADVAAASAWATPRSRQALAYAGRIDAANPETLVAELAAGTFDMLVTFTRCSGSEEVFTAGQAAAVAAALTDGRLKKVMVWHAWNLQLSAVRVPGIQASGCTLEAVLSMDANPALYSGVGAAPSGAGIPGDVASHGYCPTRDVSAMPSSVTHSWASDDANRATAISYCFGRGTVFFSQTPMDYYFSEAGFPLMNAFHRNALGVFTNDIACLTPPTCPLDAVAPRAWLPPNKKLFPVNITGIPMQDPKSPGSVTITGVQFYDVAKGAKPTFPLAVFDPAGEAVVLLRAERNGAGSGRLYRIQYKASNAAGACAGSVIVCVPRDASAKPTCPDPRSIAAWMPTAPPAQV